MRKAEDYKKKIIACCPNCFAYPDNDKIHYQNSGPIVRIFCRQCGYVVNDWEAWKNGYNNIIEYWNNHIGIYMLQD